MNKFIRNSYILALIFGVLIFLMLGGKLQQAYAASQDECAIWLCLPSGFPDGCAAAHTAMIKRLKNFKPPLPAFDLCASGESGNYKLGVEYFEPCKSGFDFIKVESYSNKLKGRCVNNNPKCVAMNDGRGGYYPPNLDCTTYNAVRRLKPNFVEMWVNGEYLGKYYYQ